MHFYASLHAVPSVIVVVASFFFIFHNIDMSSSSTWTEVLMYLKSTIV